MTKDVLAANGSTSTYRGLVGWVREYDDDDDDDDNNDDDDDLNYYNFYNNLLFSILLYILKMHIHMFTMDRGLIRPS